MTKDVTHRIAYYVKKVAEKGSVHLSRKPPRSHTYRHQRLMQYKAEMMKLIEVHQQKRI